MAKKVGTDINQCYIGKKRLDRAIALHKKTYPSGSNDTFTLTWLPYYLDRDAPLNGIPLASRFTSKHGSPEKAAYFQQRLIQIGLAEGIQFSFGGKIGHTRDAHRLIELAKTKGDGSVQTVIMDRLFKVYFEEDADITDRAMLCDVGVAAGLEADVVREWLESEEGGVEVDRQAESGREGEGGGGVPRYVIQGRYSVEGAEDPSAFLEIFHRVKSEEGAGL